MKITDLNGTSSITLDDLIVIENAPDTPDQETLKISVKDFFNSITANTRINATIVVNVLRVNDTWSPSSSSASCTKR